ncbi:MAG: haloacid dehalogenase type II [Phycisphaerales bacterium]|nr:MAG: haloacid dehalogenase type II [Phycisphaerales bacterium]
MATSDLISDRIDVISFDCYGTLIDWESGIRQVFETLAASSRHPVDPDDVFEAYLPEEAALEAGPYRGYRDLLTTLQARLAERFALDVPADRRHLLAESVPDWHPFEDTNVALIRLKERFRLAILSNIDRDLFAATARHLAIRFDLVVTAEDVRAYKPAHPHFHRLIGLVGGRREAVLHVAQSLYHDGVPAGRLGLNFIWINRRHEVNRTEATPVAEFPDLRSLADAMTE